MNSDTHTKEFVINNPKGLHARPASLIVLTASASPADIEIENLDTGALADAKSMMSVLMLAAPCGTRIRVSTSGKDADAALRTIGALIERGFDED